MSTYLSPWILFSEAQPLHDNRGNLLHPIECCHASEGYRSTHEVGYHWTSSYADRLTHWRTVEQPVLPRLPTPWETDRETARVRCNHLFKSGGYRHEGETLPVIPEGGWAWWVNGYANALKDRREGKA